MCITVNLKHENGGQKAPMPRFCGGGVFPVRLTARASREKEMDMDE